MLEYRAGGLGALGINVGHTGTVAGLLFDAADTSRHERGGERLDRASPPPARRHESRHHPDPEVAGMTGRDGEFQGGDLRGRGPVRLDLSTCVNPYGPPGAVLDALRALPASVVRGHPYTAAGDVEEAYAGYVGLPAGDITAGQGTSDLIWALARHFDGRAAGLPLPACTEFRQAFPHARRFGGGPAAHPAEVLDEAMRACGIVIVSNPDNPTGQVTGRDTLTAIARSHPGSVLVVDESYIDFLPGHGTATLAGCDAGNVVVLRSPSKFFGLAGVRSGVAWSRHPHRDRWRRGRTNWPVSAAAAAARIALTSGGWAAATRSALAGDTAWLDRALARTGLTSAPGQLHFRLLTGTAAGIAGLTRALAAGQIAVRVLDDACGVGEPALRISAPRHSDRHQLAAALGHPAGKG
jgi:histidinol-phosphate aminotransferase